VKAAAVTPREKKNKRERERKKEEMGRERKRKKNPRDRLHHLYLLFTPAPHYPPHPLTAWHHHHHHRAPPSTLSHPHQITKAHPHSPQVTKALPRSHLYTLPVQPQQMTLNSRQIRFSLKLQRRIKIYLHSLSVWLNLVSMLLSVLKC
jgi:hypothetical protein